MAEYPSASETLPRHGEARLTTLSNGLSCWTLRNRRPEGAVAFGLYIAAGSLNEREEEQGVSHFLEHLAFGGSANFPPGALADYFSSLGTRIGRHQNAFTGLEQTCYRLFLPRIDEMSLDRALLCLSDFAYRLSLEPEAVVSERAVILEEMRSREGVSMRVHQQMLRHLFPRSLLARRHPLGTEASLDGIDAEVLRRYYQRWYHPERSTVLAVGDADPEMIERLVERHFGSWRPATREVPAIDPGVRPLPGCRGAVVTDPELDHGMVKLVAAHPFELETLGDFRNRLTEQLAATLLGRRLTIRIHDGDAPYREANVSLASLLRGWRLVGASLLGAGSGLIPMAQALGIELRRIGLHGFLEEELSIVRRQVRERARQSVLNEPNRRSETVLREWVGLIAEGRRPLSKQQNQQLTESCLADLTTEELSRSFDAMFIETGGVVVGALPEGEELDPESLSRAVSAPPGEAPEPPRPIVVPTSFIDSAPGSADRQSPARESRSEELGIRSLELDNGILVHLRSMEERANRVFFEMTLAGGRIQERVSERGVTAAAALAFSQPSSRSFSSIQIRDAITAMGVEWRVNVEEDALRLRLAADPARLEDGLQLLHVLLREPEVEATALARWQSSFETYGREKTLSIDEEVAQESLRLLTGDDPRFQLIRHEEALAITRERAQSWLRDLVSSAPIEAALVGDVEDRTARTLMLRYLGSLPPRGEAKERLDELDQRRHWIVPPGPLLSSRRLSISERRAGLLTGWRAAGWSQSRERRLLSIAEQVLSSRLTTELREKRGLTYSPLVSFNPSKAYPAASMLSASFYTSPERAEEARGLTRELVESFAAEGPILSELESVRQQSDRLIQRTQSDPIYWCHVLSELRYHGPALDELTGLREEVRSFTSEDVQAALERTIVDTNLIEVLCLPAG